MRLVNDQGVIGFEKRIVLRLSQQDAVGHQLDAGCLAQPVLKAHLKTHHFAQRRFEFFSNALGHRTCRDAPWLGVANHLAVLTAPEQQGHFGQLGGFARPRFTAHDDDLVRLHGRHDLVTALAHGQVWRKGNLQS